jgi:hypothetical protein
LRALGRVITFLKYYEKSSASLAGCCPDGR